MNTTFFLLRTVFLISICFNAFSQTSPEFNLYFNKLGLKGKVKLITEFALEPVSIDTSIYKMKEKYYTVNLFSRDGYLTKSINLNEKRDTIYFSQCFYKDSLELKIVKVIHKVTKDVFIFDNNKRLLIKYYYTGPDIGHSTYEYNKLNNEVILKTKYKNELINDIVYKYDSLGNLVRNTYIIGNQDIFYQYDNHNRLIASQEFDREHNLKLKINYKYDEHGEIISSKRFAPKDSWYNISVPEITSKITYDNQGNWVLKKHYDKERLITIEKRVIEYY